MSFMSFIVKCWIQKKIHSLMHAQPRRIFSIYLTHGRIFLYFTASAYLTPYHSSQYLIHNSLFSDSMNSCGQPAVIMCGKRSKKVSLSISLHIDFSSQYYMYIHTEAKHFSTRFANFIFFIWSFFGSIKLNWKKKESLINF